jgi:ABC-type branched-subunit amino acid transport system substrate-binding protein
MQRMIWLRRLALLACFLLLAAACGNGDDTATDEPADDDTTTDEPADDGDDDAAEPTGDGLVIGTILPETGPLAFLGPPQIESVNLAIEDINAAGGVLGSDVSVINGDEAGDAAVASQSAERLLGDGVHAIVGAAASGMSFAIIDQIVGAEVVQCSASNTAPDFTTYEDDGYYFRTAPPDTGQGPLMAEEIVNDGAESVVIIARADDYGQGFADQVANALEEQGATVAETIIYDPEAASFDAEVQQATGANADAIALIAFDEGGQILQGLIEAGSGPGDIAIYGGDGLASNTLWEQVDPNDEAVLEGMKVTAPGADAEYNDRLGEITDGDTTFGGQAYDCVVAIALAAQAAGSVEPTDFVNEMRNVVGGEGTECSDYEECLQLLEDGEDINYNGPSGGIDWDDNGDPQVANYALYEIDGSGQLEQLDSREVDLSDIDF